MNLPDDFWSVNEDEPGLGGTIVALVIFVLLVVAILADVALVWAAR